MPKPECLSKTDFALIYLSLETWTRPEWTYNVTTRIVYK